MTNSVAREFPESISDEMLRELSKSLVDDALLGTVRHDDMASHSSALLNPEPLVAPSAVSGMSSTSTIPMFEEAKELMIASEQNLQAMVDELVFNEASVQPTHDIEASHGNMMFEDSAFGVFDVNSVRRDFPILGKTVSNGKPLIYFDNGATSQKPNAVIDAISDYYRNINSNIHRGVYELSQRASEAYEEARQTVANFLNAGSASEIVFVRGTTEAMNLIASSFGPQVVGEGDDIIITALEHHANILPWQRLAKSTGANLKIAPIDKNANLIISEYEKLLSHKTKIVSFTQVSNAVGTLLPARTLTEMAKKYGAYVVIDGAQSTPHMKIDCQSLGCDFFALSAHKMFGPTGIGALYGRYELLEQMPPYEVGGGMITHVTHEEASFAPAPFKFEAGTGNLADVSGLAAAIDYMDQLGFHNIERYEHELVEYAYQKLKALPYITMIGEPNERVGVLSFLVDGIDNDRVGTYLDSYGVAVRTGHHCAQPLMQFYEIPGTTRASLAFYNTRDEVDTMIRALSKIKESSYGG